MRVLFAVLLIANLALAGWQYLAHRGGPEPAVPPPGGDLRLLSERASPSEKNCFALGPLDGAAQAERIAASLRDQDYAVEVVRREESVVLGHWVYLPGPESVQDTQNLAEELAQAGVSDYAVVVDPQRRNALSLGLYQTREAAEARRADVAALGFEPRIEQRHATRQRVVLHLQQVDHDLPAAPNGYVWRPISCAAG